MAKYSVGERVIFREGGRLHRGRVTGLLRKSRRVVTDEKQRKKVPLQRLRPSPDNVLVLEACLDRSIRSPRAYGEMLTRWLAAYRVNVLYERVHAKVDLERFLQREGARASTRYVHIIAHGNAPTPAGRASLKLTLEKVDLYEDAGIFAGLNGKILIFSCCSIGADREAMERLKAISRAAAVIAYRVPVEDSYSNLHEALLYERLITTTSPPDRVARQVAKHLYDFGVKPRDIRIQKSAMVAF